MQVDILYSNKNMIDTKKIIKRMKINKGHIHI